MKAILVIKSSVMAAIVLFKAAGISTQAQPALNVISWNLDNNSTINPTDVAGLVPASNWVDTFLNNVTIGLPDNSGNPTTLNLGYGSFNTWSVRGFHPGYDADGTANRELLNGYLNAGPAGWNPPTTNTSVSFTNVPYAQYDVVVYFNSDASGRHSSLTDGTTTYYFSTMGSASVPTGTANAVFKPTSETNSNVFPSADFAFFPGLTTSTRTFTTFPKSGNDQWLGIAGFQIIQASNVYVLYGPDPSAQTVPVGGTASFSVMVGGLNPGVQWRHAGTNVADATNKTYTIASTVAGQDGDYDVVVSNSFSSVTSKVAVLNFYAPKNLRWAGVGSTWDTTSASWTTTGGSPFIAFTNTDNVRFDPLGIAQPTVTLGSTLAPGSILVSNATYTLTSGGIAGSGSMNLVNNATLILDTTDTRSGPTVVANGSTLQVGNFGAAGGLGSGAMTNNGALVFSISGDEAYGYPVYGTGSVTNNGPNGLITLSSDINGNYLTMAGGGTLLLQGNNNLTGGLVVSSGTVWARSAGAIGSSSVLVNGGELQLYFGFNFGGAAVTLAGGTVRSAGGSATLGGPVSLAGDSTISVDTGNTFLLSNSAGIAGSGFNLMITGGGTLVLPGANNAWAGVNIVSGTLQIGNGGAAGGLGAGPVTLDGGLAFNLSGNIVVTNPISSFGTIIQNGTGRTTLTADNSAFGGVVSVTNGALLINGPCGASSVTVAGGSFGGTGTISGVVDVQAGGILAPGASVGTLTVNGGLTLAGNILAEVNKSLSPSNDLVTVSGTLANSGVGTVTVNNLGPALAVGDKFTLFSQPLIGGETLTVVGSGAAWTNRLAEDGSIQVLSVTAVSRPVITSVTIAGGNSIVFSGTNGPAGDPYSVRSSTNVTTPLASWAVEFSGNFSASGSFSVTNPVSPGVPQKFYLLRQ